VPRTSSAVPRSRPSRLVGSTLLALLGVLAALVLPALPASAAPAPVSPGPQIEAFAPYQGQATCDPVARAGALALRQLVLAAYPGTGDSGIVRACSVGGASEHKEGRAWDWRVTTSNPTHVAQVADFTRWLLAPDEYGSTAAMARRLGIMYMIWDGKIWKSYQAAKGWQPYNGASPHTDHVHISLSWAGAYARTSYWTGTVSPTMYAPAKAAASPSPSATATVTVGTSPSPAAGAPSTATPVPVDAGTVADRRLQRRLVVGGMPGPWRRH